MPGVETVSGRWWCLERSEISIGAPQAHLHILCLISRNVLNRAAWDKKKHHLHCFTILLRYPKSKSKVVDTVGFYKNIINKINLYHTSPPVWVNSHIGPSISSAKIYAESRSGQPCSSSSYESTNKQCDNLYQNSFIHKLTHFLKKKTKHQRSSAVPKWRLIHIDFLDIIDKAKLLCFNFHMVRME